MKALEQKLNELTNICLNLAYANTKDGYYHATRAIELGDWDDIVWSFVDGLYQKWFFDRMEGKCSLQATIDFDIEAEEKKIDNWTVELEKIYAGIAPIYELNKL